MGDMIERRTYRESLSCNMKSNAVKSREGVNVVVRKHGLVEVLELSVWGVLGDDQKGRVGRIPGLWKQLMVWNMYRVACGEFVVLVEEHWGCEWDQELIRSDVCW